jgi:sugar transferase (PEP-CTERM/EpsH1 system associated)
VRLVSGQTRLREADPVPATAPGHALILANRLPWPLDDGWKVRTFHVIAGVASRFRTTVVVFHPSSDREVIERARSALGAGVRLVTVEPPRTYTFGNLVRGLVTRLPVHVWNQESAALRSLLRDLIRSDPIDLALIESTFMARYLDLLPDDVPSVVDTHNIDSVTFGRYVESLGHGPRRWYAAATAKRLESLEQWTFANVDAVWVCSDVERDLAARDARAGRVWTVPNGVDTDRFSPQGEKADPGSLLFFGRLDYFPNIDGLGFFANQVLPRIRATHPDVRLDIVGAGGADEIRQVVQATSGCRLLGRVEDLRIPLDRAGIIVVPLRVGGGTRLKVLEALSMARPVVSTRIGAEGIDVRDGEHLLLADTADDFAAAVGRLLDDPELGATLGRNGRDLVRRSYDWKHVGRTVAESLDLVTEARSGA